MWGRSVDSVAGFLREEGIDVHDIPCQNGQLSCICGNWQCRWGSIGDHLCEGWSHSRGRTWWVSAMFVREWDPERF